MSKLTIGRILRKVISVSQNLIFNLLYKKKLGNKVTIRGFPIIVLEEKSTLKVGKNLVLLSNAFYSGPGINHPVVLRTMSPDAIITIGNDVGISGGGIVAAKEVSIGDSVLMGANVFITDTDFHPKSPLNRRYSNENTEISPVNIGNNVFIGMDSIILKGVNIGDNSIVGAGSVVTRSIPENSISAGNPAKILSSLEEKRTL